MKFGRTLRETILKEWRFYAVDYKALKKCLKHEIRGDTVEPLDAESSDCSYSSPTSVLMTDEKKLMEFDRVLDESKEKLCKFYMERESWALDYMNTLEERVEHLRQSVPPSPPTEGIETPVSDVASSSLSSASFDFDEMSRSISKETLQSDKSPSNIADLNDHVMHFYNRRKEEYRRVGKSQHFQNFIYAKKSLSTFSRELDLLLEFLTLNNTAFYKIYKKYDKRTGSSVQEASLEKVQTSLPFLKGNVLRKLQERVLSLLTEVDSLKPRLPEGWENRKVYTIGCFDLFHRGHQNVLLSLREFGYFIVAGIHDDESYFKLKNKCTIDNLETRMQNVKPFVDQLFVIPSTDPLLYIKSVVSDQDIESGSCCYARGDDMLQFPGREWVESVMPVHFVPRTESCSSTLIRTIYHAEDESLRKKAAFAKTRYDGKPVDDEGNVLKLSVVASA
jgi:cytidyltransferase-like protein